MNWRKFLVLVLVMITVLNVPTVSATSIHERIEVGACPVQPTAVFLDCNYKSSEAFKRSFSLNSKNGDIFNFYVNNLGSCTVTISIEVDGVKKVSKSYAPGNGGHISVNVTNGLFGGARSYTVKCTSPDGAEMYVYLKAAQRTTS